MDVMDPCVPKILLLVARLHTEAFVLQASCLTCIARHPRDPDLLDSGGQDAQSCASYSGNRMTAMSLSGPPLCKRSDHLDALERSEEQGCASC